MVYVATLSEYQRVIHWRLIIKEFGTNIRNLYGIDSIVADTLSILPYTSINKYEHITSKAKCHVNKLLSIFRSENNKYCFPLNLLNIQR